MTLELVSDPQVKCRAASIVLHVGSALVLLDLAAAEELAAQLDDAIAEAQRIRVRLAEAPTTPPPPVVEATISRR